MRMPMEGMAVLLNFPYFSSRCEGKGSLFGTYSAPFIWPSCHYGAHQYGYTEQNGDRRRLSYVDWECLRMCCRLLHPELRQMLGSSLFSVFADTAFVLDVDGMQLVVAGCCTCVAGNVAG